MSSMKSTLSIRKTLTDVFFAVYCLIGGSVTWGVVLIVHRFKETLSRLLGHTFPFDELVPHAPRVECKQVTYLDETRRYIDESAMKKAYARVAKTPRDLLECCRAVIDSNFGTNLPELLAEDFHFIFQHIGPISKTEFCNVFPSFGMDKAFPNSSWNFFGFTVDPMEPDRVWFFSKFEGTHEGPLTFMGPTIEPTGKKLVLPPQVFSMSFNDQGQCYKFNGGYPVDRSYGNCGPVGGLFGILNGLGCPAPFPECRPPVRSLYFEAFLAYIPGVAEAFATIYKRVGQAVQRLTNCSLPKKE